MLNGSWSSGNLNRTAISMGVVFLISRIHYAAVFVITPVQVIRSSAQIALAPPLRCVPMPHVSAVGGSVVAVAGALLVIFGLWPGLGALMIAAYHVPVTMVMHAFWPFADPEQTKAHRDSFLLNTSLVGASLIIFWALNQSQHVPAALIASPLFGRW